MNNLVGTKAIFDRGLRPEWLDAALRLAKQQHDPKDFFDLLDIALRDDIPQLVARHKTRTTLAHIWFAPPEQARALIAWATAHEAETADRRALHLGAILATYPFFGDACAQIGRQLALNQTVHTTDIRRRLRARWGDRSTIDVSARRVVWTLRAFGVLSGGLGQAISGLRQPIQVEPPIQPWLVDALLLTRQIDEVDAREIQKAPELFMFHFGPLASGNGYPYLERFNEGGGRVIVRRCWRGVASA